MQRDPAYLLDMLQAAREAQRLSTGLTWEEFETSKLHQYALVKVIEQCSAGCAANGNIPGLTYRSQTVDLFSDGRNKNVTTTWRASVSFVSGAKTLKIGYQGSQLGDLRSANRGPNALRYRFNNGVPNQITMRASPVSRYDDLRAELGLYVQDKWTMKQLTLSGGLRFDYFSTYFPDTPIGPGPLVPTR